MSVAAKALLAALLVSHVTGCGGSSGGGSTVTTRGEAAPRRAVPPRPLAAGPRLVERAPGWVREFCAEVARRSDFLCPTEVPAGFERIDLPQERPSRRGFVLLGASQGEGRQIEARRGLAGPPLAAAHIRPAPADSLVLRWSRYVVHVAGEDTPRLRRQLRAVARGMTRG